MSGFVDLQVNGYAGVDFNAQSLSEAEVVDACRRLRSDGVSQILATIITAPLADMTEKISRLAGWMQSVPEIGQTIAGVHVEGPFLNRADGFVGAHPKDAVVQANVDDAKRLLDAGDGRVRLLTLAPECDPDAQVTRMLAESNVVVAAGHCDASLDDLTRAIDAGLSLFTHLGNACPAVMPRHDNIIQRVLSLAERLSISLVADGHHLPPFVLKNFCKIIPPERLIIVSDAISAAGLGPGEYRLSGQTVYVDTDGATWAECRTHFAGCSTPLKKMKPILQEATGLSDAQLDTAMSGNPRNLIQLPTRF